MASESDQPSPSPAPTNKKPWKLIIGVVLVSVLITGLFWPAENVSRPGGRRWACAENLRRIAEAMEQYDVTHQTLPPAYIVRNGHKHSWRVIILPYLGQKALFDLYRFDEPWDGPNNSELARRMPEIYFCPTDPPATKGGHTSYFVITGPDTVFDGEKSMPAKYIAAHDGLSSTLLVVEAVSTGIPWMEPRDLSIDDIDKAFDRNAGKFLSSYHAGGANVAFADSRTSFLSNEMDQKTLRSVITPNGRDAIHDWSHGP